MRPLRHVRMQCVNKQKIRFGNDECLIFSKKQKEVDDKSVEDRGYLGFGIKTMPAPHEMGLSGEQREIFEFYGYNPVGWQAPGS